jgi:hypothetical protein
MQIGTYPVTIGSILALLVGGRGGARRHWTVDLVLAGLLGGPALARLVP